MSDIDIDFDKVLGPEEEPAAEIFKINPDFVINIVSVTAHLINERPQDKELEILYYTVKNFLNEAKFYHKNDQALSGFFSTYVESYRGLKVHQHNMRKDEEEFVPLNLEDPFLLYNEATLSIFDLYLLRSFDPLVRRLLVTATTAIHQVVTGIQSAQEDRPVMEAISDLSNLALISQTLPRYTKGVKRSKNFDYIRWLKDFLLKTVSTVDLSFIRQDDTLKKVIKQITTSEKVIVL